MMKKTFFLSLSLIMAVGILVSFASAQQSLVRARVSSVTNTSAVIYLDGWDAGRSGETYTLYRNNGTSDTTINVGAASFWRDTVPTGKTYTYRLTKNPGGDVGTASVNVTIRPGTIMKGVGWSSMDGAGIGWISVNSDTREPQRSGPHSPVPYGIYADESGELHGVMWAGHVSGNPSTGWGWLSFNKEDLVGCPEGTCSARVSGDGKIFGWAKFINTTGVEDTWSGWVNLRSGTNYGLCFGDPEGVIEVDGVAYYSGGTCKANGGATHPVLTGAAWVGLNSDEPGGWLLFASSSLQIINGTSTGANIMIQPEPPHKVAIRDVKNFWTNRNAAWLVDNVKSGNLRYGTVTPDESSDGQLVDYLAPKTIPNPANTTIKASTTESVSPGVDVDPLTVVPPYSLVCIPEGNTSIRLIITKNYFDPNYFTRNPHKVDLWGDTKTPIETIIASSTTGAITSFAHTGLKEKQMYNYQLVTKYNDDQYVIKTPIASCQTGATPAPIEGVTSLNAYANTSKSIYVNWKDNMRGTASYEFEVQRMRITPDKDIRLTFRSTGATKAEVIWENKTIWVPYAQKLLRSDDGGATFSPVLGQVSGWPYENPPTSTMQYVFSDAVTMGTQYQYKLEVCANLDLEDIYSTPVKGGTEKPSEVCVISPVFNYLHSWSGGESESFLPNATGKVTASLLDVMQKTTRIFWNAARSLADVVGGGFETLISSIAGLLKVDNGMVFAEEPTYDAYFSTAIITKNPSYKDEDLLPDTVYIYRASVLSENPAWSDFRAVKTLKDDDGGSIENRPVCTRNSFCDATVTGVKSRDLSESSEQQCFVNKDCVNVGRSDQGVQER